MILVVVGIGLFAALMNLSVVLRFMEKVTGLILPVIIGGILALFFNVPMTGIEKRLRQILGKRRKKYSNSTGGVRSYLLSCVSHWYSPLYSRCSSRSL